MQKSFLSPDLLSRSIAGLLLSAVVSHAATVGYWRFEDSPGFTNDSSGNGNSLSTEGTAPTQVAIPSDFPSTLPQTGASNAEAASFGGSGSFSAADDTAFDFSATPGFTVEAFVSPDSVDDGLKLIAAQYGTTGDQRGWFFGLRDNDLTLAVSQGGDSATSDDTTFSTKLVSGNSYYVAAAYDDSSSNLIFYLQDLTGGGELLSQTFSPGVLDEGVGIFNSTADFTIGDGIEGVATDYRFSGVIDEVRLSNTVLGSGDLLVSVPEPSVFALLAGLGGFAWVALRRR